MLIRERERKRRKKMIAFAIVHNIRDIFELNLYRWGLQIGVFFFNSFVRTFYSMKFIQMMKIFMIAFAIYFTCRSEKMPILWTPIVLTLLFCAAFIEIELNRWMLISIIWKRRTRTVVGYLHILLTYFCFQIAGGFQLGSYLQHATLYKVIHSNCSDALRTQLNGYDLKWFLKTTRQRKKKKHDKIRTKNKLNQQNKIKSHNTSKNWTEDRWKPNGKHLKIATEMKIWILYRIFLNAEKSKQLWLLHRRRPSSLSVRTQRNENSATGDFDEWSAYLTNNSRYFPPWTFCGWNIFVVCSLLDTLCHTQTLAIRFLILDLAK